jgi:hypothetical protein
MKCFLSIDDGEVLKLKIKTDLPYKWNNINPVLQYLYLLVILGTEQPLTSEEENNDIVKACQHMMTTTSLM